VDVCSRHALHVVAVRAVDTVSCLRDTLQSSIHLPSSFWRDNNDALYSATRRPLAIILADNSMNFVPVQISRAQKPFFFNECRISARVSGGHHQSSLLCSSKDSLSGLFKPHVRVEQRVLAIKFQVMAD
jgi:hypothetical protein